MPRGKKAREVPQKKPLLKARKKMMETGQKEDYYAAVVKVYRPIVERELAKQGIDKKHAEFPALESELLMVSIRAVDRHFKNKLKAPLPTTVATSLESKAKARVSQIMAEKAFRQQFFKGLNQAKKIPAPVEVPIAKRRELQALVDRGHQLLRSKKIKPFFTENELRVLKARLQGSSFQQIGQHQPTPVTRAATRITFNRASQKLLLLAEGKKLPILEEARKQAPVLTELKFDLKRQPGEISYRQKVAIKIGESRGLNRLFRKIKFRQPPYSNAQRKLLKEFVGSLNINEQKVLKYLYSVNWGFERALPSLKERRTEVGKLFSMRKKELNDWEKEILKKLERMVKGQPHSP